MTRKETLEHAKAIVDRIFHKKEEHVTMKGWVARDDSGLLFVYGGKPTKSNLGYWSSYTLCRLNDDDFPQVKREDEEPIEAELIVKIHKK